MKSATVEHLSPCTAQNPLSSDLLRDFYQTFRLSQNEAAVQPPLFMRLAERHQAAGNTALLPVALELADGAVDKLMPPARHAVTDESSRNNAESGFRAMWNEYSEVLLDPAKGINRNDEYVLEDMLAWDQHYQEQARPGRSEGGDPHESIVREYILGNRLTGSGQLLQVRSQLKEALLVPSEENGKYMLERLQIVTAKWEANHPGRVLWRLRTPLASR